MEGTDGDDPTQWSRKRKATFLQQKWQWHFYASSSIAQMAGVFRCASDNYFRVPSARNKYPIKRSNPDLLGRKTSGRRCGARPGRDSVTEQRADPRANEKATASGAARRQAWLMSRGAPPFPNPISTSQKWKFIIEI